MQYILIRCELKIQNTEVSKVKGWLEIKGEREEEGDGLSKRRKRKESEGVLKPIVFHTYYTLNCKRNVRRV